MNAKQKDAFLIRGAFFIVSGLAMLLIVACLIQRYYPKPLDDTRGITEYVDGAGSGSNWWERFKKKFQVPRIKRRLQHDPSQKANRGKLVEGTGTATTVTDRQQMLLRQRIIAELQLADYEGRPLESAWDRTQMPYGNYPWKTYEADRMKAAIFAQRHEENYNHRWLKPFLDYANRAAGSEFANFEDFFWAGRANLFAGDLRQARNYLHLAKRQWPVKSGLLYGMTELMLALTDALGGKTSSMEKRIETIRSVFPDWLYTEIYQPDFEYFEQKYPNKPLIFMLHGRMLAMGFNDAKAMELYRKAFQMPELGNDAKKVLRDWLDTLEEVHDK